ncbi:anti-sigma factor [Bosea sp. F3-2]|uniref:anti-sigma factor n=1 Tax=Bosea sp. F3-2 TaxID=2599640 RepID=UPI0011EEB27F|nr:anti-sigma factor [Bosea sp. F3-2]QEL22279.1 anti-sigma factor [Bosea sp. F3-2]
MHDDNPDREGDVSWDKLSAYIDDELSPGEAADVAAAVARDPRLAERVATLSRLRAVTRRLPSETEIPAFVLPRRRRRRVALPIAAALSLAACIGFLALRLSGPATAPDGGLAAAVAAHRHWIDGRQAEVPEQRIQVDLAAARSGRLPDLRASALELTYLSLDPTSREGGMLAGYRGPHGCRLGLWMAPRSRGSGEPPAKSDRDGLRIRAWSTTEADYALLSRGMDPERLDRLADVIAKLTHQKQAPTDEQVAALRDVPNIGQPCGA